MNDTHEGGTGGVEMPGNKPQPQPSGQGKNVGPLIGIIIIIVVLILGGLYFWGARVDQTEQLEENTNADDVDSIESDLEGEDFSDLDAEFDAMEAELDAETTTTP